MASIQSRYASIAIAVVIVAAIPAGAQIAPCVSNAGGVMYGISSSRNGTIFPFTATFKSTFEQKLPDGNAIHNVTHSREARDSSGRTMTEMSQGCARGEDGKMHERFNINVNDPTLRTNMGWITGSDEQAKVVNVFHQPDPFSLQQAKPPDPDPAELARRQRMMQTARVQQAEQRKENHSEDLGTKQINGVLARGQRNTRTIPAGEEGNDQPLVVISETWRSTELGLTLMAINDDPRRGRTTTECESLDRSEPDPALFLPPAGYKIEDRTPTIAQTAGR